MIVVVVVLGMHGPGARIRVAKAEVEAAQASLPPRISPATARRISVATVVAGLGLTAYLWQHSRGLEEGHGRFETQLAGFGMGVATLSLGPAVGLMIGGAYRRGATGALGRPLLALTGATGVAVGSLVTAWGCFEAKECTGAKVAGGVMVGASVAMIAGSLVWGVVDLVVTPGILRHRQARTVGVVPMLGADRVGLAISFTN